MDEETKNDAATEQTGAQGSPDEPETVNSAVDVDKTVDKLKKRLGKEQAEKNDYKTQLDSALAQLDEFKQGKGVKELSDEERAKQADSEKDKQIQELTDKINLNEAKQQTDKVFKESGLVVDEDLLNAIVSVDNEQTFANASAVIKFANSVQDATRKELLKGTTPRTHGATVKTVDKAAFDQMSAAERVALHNEDPEQFNKLTGGF